MQTAGSSLTDRMVRAARLDVSVYEEVEHDTSATQQALYAVLVAAVADGIGLAVGGIFGGSGGIGGAFGALILGTLGAVLGWVVWSYVTYWVGTNLFKGTATPGELLRTIGFAQAPRALNIVGFVPVLGGLVRLAVFFWLLVTGIVAIRQALDIDTGKAIATAVVGWIALIVISAVVGLFAAMLGIGAMAMAG